MNLIKIVDKSKKYTDKKGVERCSVNYYIVTGDTYIPIKPCFGKGYVQLDMICEVRKNG